MDKDDLNHDEIEDERRKRKMCFLICLIVLLVMTLPSTIAFLAIFR